MANVTIIGIGSDIGYELGYRFIAEEGRVQGTYFRNRPDKYFIAQGSPFPSSASVHLVQCDVTNHNHCKEMAKELEPWDVLIFCPGTLAPVKPFFECDPFEWRESFRVNCLGPLMLLRYLYPIRKEDAQVCFFSGPNPFKTNPNYSAYSSSKAALVAAVKEINAEGLKCFALAPGFVQTKIHQATIDAGVKNERLEKGGGTSHDQIFAAMKKLLNSDKAGGHLWYAPDVASGVA